MPVVDTSPQSTVEYLPLTLGGLRQNFYAIWHFVYKQSSNEYVQHSITAICDVRSMAKPLRTVLSQLPPLAWQVGQCTIHSSCRARCIFPSGLLGPISSIDKAACAGSPLAGVSSYIAYWSIVILRGCWRVNGGKCSGDNLFGFSMRIASGTWKEESNITLYGICSDSRERAVSVFIVELTGMAS